MEHIPKHSKTPAIVAIFYGAGTLGSAATGFVISSWLLYFYLPPDGAPLIPVAFYGLITLASYVISASLIPFVGYISDNTYTRWGRRLPYMLVSVLPLTVLFVLLWTPPLKTESYSNLVFLLLIFILYKIAGNFYLIPYQALLPELALTDRDRIRMSAWQSGFLLVGFMLGGLAGWIIGDFGFLVSALGYSAVGLFMFCLPMLVAHRAPNRYPEKKKQASFLESFLATLRNRLFLYFAITWALVLVTSAFIQMSTPFIVTEICRLDESDTILFYIPALLVSLACYPVVTRLSDRFGKWPVYAGSLLASAVLFPGTLLIGSGWPVSLKGQCISWAVLQAVAISGAIVLANTFIAEITDYDAVITGQRREGMYFAVMKVLDQILTGLASSLLPLLFLLGRSTNDTYGPLGVRLAGLAGGLMMFIAFIFFLKYPKLLSTDDT